MTTIKTLPAAGSQLLRRIVAVLAAGALLSFCPPAFAAEKAHWAIDSIAAPTDFSIAANVPEGPSCGEVYLQPNHCDFYDVTATDVGAAAMKAKNVTIEDTLPACFARAPRCLLVGTRSGDGRGSQQNLNEAGTACTATPPHLTCTIKGAFFGEVGRTVRPDDTIKMEIAVRVLEPATPGALTNQAKVSIEGSAGEVVPAAETSATNTLEEGAPPFGAALFSSPASTPKANPPPWPAPTPMSCPPNRPSTVDQGRSDRPYSGTSRSKIPATSSSTCPRAWRVGLSTPRRCKFAELKVTRLATATNLNTPCPAQSQVRPVPQNFPRSSGPTSPSPSTTWSPSTASPPSSA